MDILAHGLWTHAIHRGVATAKNIKLTKRNIWIAIFFGLAPDLFSFGPYFIQEIVFHGRQLFGGPPNPALIPTYVYYSYNFTHSIVVFLAVFLLLWTVFRKPYWLMFGWGLHILFDIFSHDVNFFPTPFLFPVSNFKFDGISWSNPAFMAVNYSLLIMFYAGLFLFMKLKKKAPP